LASLGATMPIGIAPLFSATVRDAGVVTSDIFCGPIDSAALPKAVDPVGSDTL
jgi:hypothetical protein